MKKPPAEPDNWIIIAEDNPRTKFLIILFPELLYAAAIVCLWDKTCDLFLSHRADNPSLKTGRSIPSFRRFLPEY